MFRIIKVTEEPKVNRNTSLAYFTISKLRNKPKHFKKFIKFYYYFLLKP